MMDNFRCSIRYLEACLGVKLIKAFDLAFFYINYGFI